VNGIDLSDVEREIGRLPDVSVARIVADDAGRVTEVHVVAHAGKHPKQIVRDVQSVALASFGLDLDRRIVSVVQLGPGGVREEVPDQRPSIAGITAESSGVHSLVRVTLVRDGDEVTGTAQGSVATTARYRLVAHATLDALQQLENGARSVDIDHAQVQHMNGHDVALVTIVFIAPPAEHVVVGAAMVRAGQEADAVARAVLDATNRRLAWHPGPNGIESNGSGRIS
jgi:hypothetical protein